MPKPKFNIVIIGSGNVANAMANLFSKKHKIVQIVSRNKKTGSALAKKIKGVYSPSLTEINTQADFYFLCVPDDAIKAVSKKLSRVRGIIVHHSGSKSINEISLNHPKIVLYPFLSINKETDLNNTHTTLFYQSKNSSTNFLIQQLFTDYKFKAIETDDKNRQKLHLAAVLVNNFTNHLYFEAEELTKGIPCASNLLAQLAEQSLKNLKSRKTKENQTGPARRNDKSTQKEHLDLIKKNKELSKIYVSLSNSITKTYTHE